MITAKKSKAFMQVFRSFSTYQLKKHFYTIHVNIPESTRRENSSAIFIMNHSSWWDGLLCLQLNERLYKDDAYAMMTQVGLEKFPFFRKLGAFSINNESSAEVRKSLRYASEKLDDGASIWLFPQGEEKHQEIRPLDFKRGTALLASKHSDARITIITAYYTFGGEQKPEIYIQASEPFLPASTGTKEISEELETKTTKQLEALRQSVITKSTEEFETLITGRKTISEWFSILSGTTRKSP